MSSNSELWNKINQLSRGNTEEKINAADLLMDNFWGLPRTREGLLIDLSKSGQPKEVRLHIAERLFNGIDAPFHTRGALLDTLSRDKEDYAKNLVQRAKIKHKNAQKFLDSWGVCPVCKEAGNKSTIKVVYDQIVRRYIALTCTNGHIWTEPPFVFADRLWWELKDSYSKQIETIKHLEGITDRLVNKPTDREQMEELKEKLEIILEEVDKITRLKQDLEELRHSLMATY